MRVFVTGHKGYIGTNLYKAGLVFEGCDIKDGTDFVDLKWMDIDVLVHLAASVSVTKSMSDPQGYLDNNCFKLMKFLTNNKVKKVILTSTAAVYGEATLATEREASWSKCTSPYAQSKYLAEEVVRGLAINHCIFRLANVYGGDTTNRGEASVHTHFSEDPTILVYGGGQSRDFVPVETVCNAIIKATLPGNIGTFNVGSGTCTRIVDLAASFSKDRGIPVTMLPPRPGEVFRNSVDINKARAHGLIP